jgi:hypothetical protein
MRPTRPIRARSLFLVVLLSGACAEPPNKEIDQAQGAVDAARAAGAERYAPAEYGAASQALRQATEAVGAGDYRLALNFALESREQAQNAARVAADTRAELRGSVERSLAELALLVSQTRARVEEASGISRDRQARASAEALLDRLETALQEARTSLRAEDYRAAERQLTEVRAQMAEVDQLMPPRRPAQSSQRRQ